MGCPKVQCGCWTGFQEAGKPCGAGFLQIAPDHLGSARVAPRSRPNLFVGGFDALLLDIPGTDVKMLIQERRVTMRTHIVIAWIVVSFLFAAMVGVAGVAYNRWDAMEQEKAKSIAQAKRNKEETARLKTPDDRQQKVPLETQERLRQKQKADVEEKAKLEAAKPREPAARELLQRGRELIRSKNSALAELTFGKALLACGDSKEDQLLKAELYLRYADLREKSANADKYDYSLGGIGKLKPGQIIWHDPSRDNAEAILKSQGKNFTDTVEMRNAIQFDHWELDSGRKLVMKRKIPKLPSESE
jgi:hypothetical protein